MRKEAGRRLERFLAGLVEEGLYTAVVGLVASGEGMEWTHGEGRVRPDPPRRASAGTLFDLASLSKPFTATLALRLDGLGLLPLELPVGEVWPRACRRLARRTLEDLLRHRSGLLAWAPLYARCRDRAAALALLLGGDFQGARRGTYSDLGYILWGLAAEEYLGAPLDELLGRHLLEPLGPGRVTSRPGSNAELAPCAIDTAREVELAAEQGLAIDLLPPPAAGEPQDGNARFLGGFPGHAGLFGRTRGLYRLAAEWLQPGSLLEAGQVAAALGGRGPYALGWARPRARGAAGQALSPSAFGHIGFTGGSLWIDPEAGRILVLLGHRASPRSDLTPARQRFNALAMSG